MNAHPSWSPETLRSLAPCIERYGGWGTWESLDQVSLELTRMSGPLIRWKGVNRWLGKPQRLVVSPKRCCVTFSGPGGETARYDNGNVFIGPETFPAHRTSMANAAMWTRWSNAGTVYFFGYALVTYLSVPFLLPSLELLRADAARRVFTVRFPDGCDTHCPVQAFHFDLEGLLARHDYTAEVVGPWAKGSHFTTDYTNADGFPIAQTRRVVWNIAGRPTWLPVLCARLRVREKAVNQGTASLGRSCTPKALRKSAQGRRPKGGHPGYGE